MLQEICTIAAGFCGGCKNCCYRSHIAAFFQTVAVVVIFCGALQQQYIEPLQYVCFSGVYIDIAALQRIYRNKYSICVDTIVVVLKIAVICKF